MDLLQNLQKPSRCENGVGVWDEMTSAAVGLFYLFAPPSTQVRLGCEGPWARTYSMSSRLLGNGKELGDIRRSLSSL